jgi:hypothetical protein
LQAHDYTRWFQKDLLGSLRQGLKLTYGREWNMSPDCWKKKFSSSFSLVLNKNIFLLLSHMSALQ